jgi:hypothetical protein
MISLSTKSDNFTLQNAGFTHGEHGAHRENHIHALCGGSSYSQKEKQTICAILLEHATQDPFHPAEIEWETCR